LNACERRDDVAFLLPSAASLGHDRPVIFALFLATLLPAAQGFRPPPPAPVRIASEPGNAPARIERGEGQVPLILPLDEELTFDVIIDVGILGDIDVGDVKLS
jgi:hypothetical protein